MPIILFRMMGLDGFSSFLLFFNWFTFFMNIRSKRKVTDNITSLKKSIDNLKKGHMLTS